MTDRQVDLLWRELLIGAEASRKLSIALRLAWAQLTDSREGPSVRSSEKAVSPVPIKNKDGPQALPMSLEDPFE